MELQPGVVVHRGCDHIFFIGFLGSGKTTLARNIGTLFGRSFCDIDRMVERSMHASIDQIFEKHGEQAFRNQELLELKKLMTRKSLLVSSGSGIVEHPQSRALMKQIGVVVFLDGALEDSLRQIQRADRRPDMGSGTHEELKALYNKRRPLYEQLADITISIRNKDFSEVAQEASKDLWDAGLL